MPIDPTIVRDKFVEDQGSAVATSPAFDLDAAIAGAAGRIAPLWPLESFVAVNPFLGYTQDRFADARHALARVAGAPLLMERAFYRAAHAAGRLTDAHIDAALGESGSALTRAEVLRALATDAPAIRPDIATVAEVIDASSGTDWAAIVTGEIAKWCAAYCDDGQAAWAMPFREKPLYPAWREAARLDRTPETLGLAHFRAYAGGLPDDPRAVIAHIVDALALPAAAVEDYLHRCLLTVKGYASFLRYRGWGAELDGGRDDALVHLLAVRVAFDGALFTLVAGPERSTAWMAATARMATPRAALAEDPDLVVHRAYEIAFQAALAADLAKAEARPAQARPAAQAAFCIDVRSEVFRRALERVAPEVETIGFAGFFGVPVEVVRLGAKRGYAQCPVLLKPAAIVCEAVDGGSREEEVRERTQWRRRFADIWSSFKSSAVSSFAFVESAGLAFGARIVKDGLVGADRPEPVFGAKPSLDGARIDGRIAGLTLDQRIATAQGLLKGMSLGSSLARIVLLCGHGSTSANNPHAAGLDCGACGGHTGEANTRIAALVLNDPQVREGLAARGLALPSDTWFLAGLHDTTTDTISLYETAGIPDSHREDLAALRRRLDDASALTRRERAAALGLKPEADLERALDRRSRDWSEVRPEWGLAGNAAFIAAPRSRTAGLDLKGRAFLHSYEWQKDDGFGVLELIMTAPMVVASWINLQYYGSTVSNAHFGSGNKVLHNVVGRFGVLQGHAGDLEVGLPWQSVHDGRRLMHEPLRLSVFIEAPEEAIDAVLRKHEGVRRLVENGWLYLFAMNGTQVRRWAGLGEWREG